MKMKISTARKLSRYFPVKTVNYGSCQHCYKDLESDEFYCPHCKYSVCEGCYETSCEIHEDEEHTECLSAGMPYDWRGRKW